MEEPSGNQGKMDVPRGPVEVKKDSVRDHLLKPGALFVIGVIMISALGYSIRSSDFAKTATSMAEGLLAAVGLAPATPTPSTDPMREIIALNAQLASPFVMRSLGGGDPSCVALVKKRKEIWLRLVKTNPSAAYATALSDQVKRSLPTICSTHIEQPATVEGRLVVKYVDDFARPEKSRHEYSISMDDKSQLAFYPLVDMRGSAGSRIRAQGLRLDTTVVTAKSPSTLSVRSDSSAIPTTGEQKVLVLLVNFQDSINAPAPTAAVLKNRIFNTQIQNYFKEQSHSKMSLSGDVLGWYTIPKVIGTTGNPEPTLAEVSEIMRANNINPTGYNRLVVVVNHPSYQSGVAYVGLRTTRLMGVDYTMSFGIVGDVAKFDPTKWTNFDAIFVHEFGHMLGLEHAHSLECGAGNVISGDTCVSLDYGNQFDVMGRVGTHPVISGHYNTATKEFLGWLATDSVVTVNTLSAGQSITLKPLESASGTRTIKIQPPGMSSAAYYVEYRRAIGFDSELASDDLRSNQNGVFILKSLPVDQNNAAPEMYLLDMTPQRSGKEGLLDSDWNEVTLNAGAAAFYDPATGITIGPVSVPTADGVTVNVGIRSVSCTVATPIALRYSPLKQLVAPSNPALISFNLINRDSIGCPPSTFQVNPRLPADISLISSGFTGSYTLPMQSNTRVAIPLFLSDRILKSSYTVPVGVTRNGIEKILGTSTFETDPTVFYSRFKVGDKVQTIQPTVVLTAPENASKLAFFKEAGVLSTGAVRTVTGESRLTADGQVVRKIAYQEGVDGWVYEGNIQLFGDSIPPAASSLQLLTPEAGSTIDPSKQVTISWKSSGVEKITLSIGNEDIVYGWQTCIPNTGSYIWDASTWPTRSKPIRIEVKNCIGIRDPAFVADWTDAPFRLKDAGDSIPGSNTATSTISGGVYYYSGATPVSGVMVKFTTPQNTVLTAFTDAKGQYSISGVPANSVVSLSRLGNDNDRNAFLGANGATQISNIQTIIAESRGMNNPQSSACNVTGDGTVEISDAVALVRHINQGTPLPVVVSSGKTWNFFPLAANTATTKNFSAALVGDCAGLWKPGP